MPIDPAQLLAAVKRKSEASERNSENSNQLLHILQKKRRSQRLSSLLDKESLPHEEGNGVEVPLEGSKDAGSSTPMESLLAAIDELRSQSSLQSVMGRDNLVSRSELSINSMSGACGQSSAMEETSQSSRNKLEDQFQRDLSWEIDQLLGKIFEAQSAAKKALRQSEENTRASVKKREELELVARAQQTKISELFASLNRKDAELAEVCVASWAFKERIWELELDLKAKDSWVECLSAEVKELRGELAQAKKEASEEKLHNLAIESAEEAFSACLNQIKVCYPELDLSFSDLGAALEAWAVTRASQ